MHFLLFWCLLIHPRPDTDGPSIPWNNTKNWKIYSLNNSGTVFSISIDSVRLLSGVPLGDDSMHILLSTAKLLHVPSSPAWMGCYLTSCEDENGRHMKIIVSQYGGFFYNSSDGNYYQVDNSFSRTWLNYMRRAYIKTE